MALITNNISGSSSDSWRIGITGSVRIANPGAGSFPAMPGTDVEFFVSGSRGGKGTSGVSVFGGDTVISGTLTVGTGSITIDSNEIRFQGGVAKITSGSGGLTFFDSGNTGGVTLTSLVAGGVDIYWSSVTAGEVFTTGSVVTSGSVTVKDGTGAGKVILPTNGNITGSNLHLTSNSLTTSQTTFNLVNDTATTLNVGGAATAITVGFASSNVVVPGNLTVQGTTTTVDTTNLLVKDPVVLMASGAAGPNANGGIAIFSGSSGAGSYSGAPDLVLGRVANDTWGVGALATNNGTVTSLTSMTLANMRAAVFEVNDANYALRRSGTTLILSGGAGSDVAISGSQNIAPIATDFTLKRSGTEMITFSSSSAGPYGRIANITARESNVLALQSDASDAKSIFGKTGAAAFASIYSGSVGSNPNVAFYSSEQSIDTAVAGTEVHFVANSTLVSTVTNAAVLPGADVTYNLGSPSLRWANIYTGDLHLRNDRGDYTLIEEEDFLSIRFNKTGKRYKFVLEPVPELDE